MSVLSSNQIIYAPCVVGAVLQVLTKALKKATGSGISGASAAVVQVVTLMWLRTVMNYQYRYARTV